MGHHADTSLPAYSSFPLIMASAFLFLSIGLHIIWPDHLSINSINSVALFVILQCLAIHKYWCTSHIRASHWTLIFNTITLHFLLLRSFPDICNVTALRKLKERWKYSAWCFAIYMGHADHTPRERRLRGVEEGCLRQHIPLKR